MNQEMMLLSIFFKKHFTNWKKNSLQDCYLNMKQNKAIKQLFEWKELIAIVPTENGNILVS